MPSPLRSTITVLACALLVGGCGSGSQISASKARSLVLSKGDLSGPFHAFAAGSTATLDTGGTPRSDMQRFDRKSGWVARFNRSGTVETKGPLVVASTVDIFANAGGAKDDLAAFRRQFERQVAEGGARFVPVGDLGDQALAVSSLQPGRTGVRTFAIAWRERNATASVTANGFAGKVNLGNVLALARRQQAKLAVA